MTKTKRVRSTDSASAAIHELTALSEAELQANVIIPLLVALGFENIRDASGPRERGCDLVAVKHNDFNRPELWTVQIKRWKPDAKAASSRSFGHLINQLGQALKEPVVNPDSGKMEKPSRCLFFTPFPVPIRAQEDFNTRLHETVNAGAEIVDGPALVRLLLDKCPATLAAFSMKTQYRLKLLNRVRHIDEARVAFDGKQILDLERIYVDVTLVEDGFVERLSARSRTPRVLTPEQRHELQSHVAKFLVALGPDRSEDIGDSDNDDPLAAVFAVLDRYRERRARLALAASPPAECTAIASYGTRLRHALKALRKCQIAADILSGDSQETMAELSSVRGVSFPISVLLKVNAPVLMLGGPGAGKSTSLRWLARLCALDSDGPMPILLSLGGTSGSSPAALLEHSARQLERFGYHEGHTDASLEALRGLLESGDVRLFFDGLDEAGSHARDILKSIDLLSQRYPRAPILVTCRDTFGIELWNAAFAVRVRPFSDEQIVSFVKNWFRSDDKEEKLIYWLTEHPWMREASRTPIIAALLCTLFEVQADLPSTEVDLYEKRFDLLLGRWEQAKGQTPLGHSERRRYMKFLQTLAFLLHSQERRTTPLVEAIGIAGRFERGDGEHPDVERYDLVDDCVHRGLLEREVDDNVGFGHLTYQEFLSAGWLQDRNEYAFIWSRLDDPWWAKTFEFYAARTADITALIRAGISAKWRASARYRIEQLADLAPFTSEQALLDLEAASGKGAIVLTPERTPLPRLD